MYEMCQTSIQKKIYRLKRFSLQRRKKGNKCPTMDMTTRGMSSSEGSLGWCPVMI